MARQKRSSPILEVARRRLAGLKSITKKPDYGPSLSVADYEQDIVAFSTLLDEYNGALAALDDLQNRLGVDEDRLNDKNRRMLAATEANYGPDSSEYEMAGGTRKSERKKPGRKKGGGSGTPTT